MADVLILAAGTASAPADYEVPNAQIILPKAVHAVFDGTGASGGYLAVLEILSDAGITVAKCPMGTAIAAGGTAEVSWFPCAALSTADTAGLPVSETLYLDPTAASVMAASVLQTGTTYLISVQGTYSLWNTALGTGTPEANAMFPPASTAGRVSTQVGLDADTTFAIQTGSGVPIGHSTAFEMNLGGGWGHVEPSGGPFTTPTGDHYYTYSVTGQGSAPLFRINDNNPPDNYGLLKISIYSSPAGGGVVGLAAADTSVVVAGSASAPTVRTASLDVIATDHPTAADWSNNSHKITSVTDPTNAQDAATKNYVDTHGGSGTITSIGSSGGSITVTNPVGPATNVDVAASGVAAGTYGDSTHVPRVTVGADGRVTAATNVALAGSGASVLLFSSTLGADAAAIDTNPTTLSGYTILEIWAYLRSTQVTVTGLVNVTFNNDTGANYMQEGVTGAANVVSASQANSQTGIGINVPGATALAASFGMVKMTIPLYDTVTAGNKAWELLGSLPDNAATARTQIRMGEWINTAAVTRIAVTGSGGNLKAGSALVIFGR